MATVAATSATAPQAPAAHSGRDALIPFALMAVVLIMVIPLPGAALDLLLATSISLALTILMVAVSTPTPLQFSTLPSVLLVVTLFRLALNVAATRAILLHGAGGTSAA